MTNDGPEQGDVTEGDPPPLPLTTDLTLANHRLETQNRELLALTAELEKTLDELRHSQEVIRQLAGFLPVCSYCRRLRDGEGAEETWSTLESYLARKTVTVTHGVCPDCFAGLIGRLE